MEKKNLLFLWSVERFDSLPIVPFRSLLSPRFYADESRTVELCLSIEAGPFPTRDDQYLGNLFVCRCDYDGPENVEIEYRIAFDENQDYGPCKEEFLKPLNDALCLSSEAESFQIYKDDMVERELVIMCEILSCTEKRTETSEVRDKEDLVKLSQEFQELFETSLLPDAIIRVQNREFKVHKAVLDARCHGLLKECEAIQSREAYTLYDECTIQKLLHYLYTGRFECENLPDDLCFLLRKRNKSVFSRLCLSNVNELHAFTCFKSSKICCDWVIENFFNFPRSMEFHKKIIDNDPSTWFRISFLTIRDNSEVKEVKFVMSKIRKETVTFAVCKISVMDREGEPTVLYKGSCLFNDERTFQISLDDKLSIIRSKLYDQAVMFNIDVKITDGVPVNSLKNFTGVSDASCSRNITDLSQLARDIGKLFNDPYLSDVILKVKDRRIFAHKAILSARSSVFRRKFQHSNSETGLAEFAMNDLDEEVALSMIQYIYSAQIVNFNTDLAFELYNAANLYGITLLKKKCFRCLQSSLNETNVGQILLFADAQNDLELKSFVYDFVNSDPDTVLESRELKGVLRSYDYLFMEYLNELSNKTAGMLMSGIY